MNIRLTRRAAAASFLATLLSAAQRLERKAGMKNWMVYYGSQVPPEGLGSCDLYVFDSRYHPPLDSVTGSGRIVAGYLSVGEASPDYAYYGRLEAQGLLHSSSAIWQGNRFIDIRDRRWQERVLRDLIPSILAQGFNGVFLDTIDSALGVEQSDPMQFGGMSAAARDLIWGIRELYPTIKVVVNRAYPLLPDIALEIDAVVGESVFATYDFAQKRYFRVAAADYARQRDWLQDAQLRNPKLTVCTLDYCDPTDLEQIRSIYREQRANGFVPYVTSVDLTTIVREPA